MTIGFTNLAIVAAAAFVAPLVLASITIPQNGNGTLILSSLGFKYCFAELYR